MKHLVIWTKQVWRKHARKVFLAYKNQKNPKENLKFASYALKRNKSKVLSHIGNRKEDNFCR